MPPTRLPRLLGLAVALLTALPRPAIAQPEPFRQLDTRLQRGNQRALFELAPYLDSQRVVREFLGYHLLQTKQANIARRLLEENCLFTKAELNPDSAVSARQLTELLVANRARLVFDPLAAAFLLTPLEQRTATARFRGISPVRRQELEARAAELFARPEVRAAHIDSLVARHNPAALLLLAAELFKARYRFNLSPEREPYLDLLQLLTGTEIGVENEKHELSWHPDADFYPASQLNVLIYFATAYRQYHWSQVEQQFVNSSQAVTQPGREQALFDLLSSPADSMAMRAFVQLTTCPPATVAALAAEQEKVQIISKANYALPTFPYRFLPQLSLLTAYCRANGLDYLGSAALRQAIDKLQTNLSFAERYQLENQLINSLPLSATTALEYWTLIHEQSYSLVHSSGRILDVLYSRHWRELLADQRQLDCYLKKAALFDRLGIIGSCNNYLLKFSNSAAATLAQLGRYHSPDPDVQQKLSMVLANPAAIRRPATAPGPAASNHNDGNRDTLVMNLEAQLQALAPRGVASAAQQEELVKLLANISYAQIGTALRFLEPMQFDNARLKYSFLYSDWGFFSLGDLEQPAVRHEFLRLYSRLSEKELYSYLLDQVGVDYRRPDQSLDYDKLYEHLKYDNAQALVGGGGAADPNEVYALVKLLELHFHTTRGFPHKVCNSAGIYHCSLVERTNAWLTYLAQHQLLRRPHFGPPSFSLE